MGRCWHLAGDGAFLLIVCLLLLYFPPFGADYFCFLSRETERVREEDLLEVRGARLIEGGEKMADD